MPNKLTKQQAAVLKEVARLTQKVGHANAYGHNLNRGVLHRLEKAGFVHSERPFAGEYHTVTITDAGREALKGMIDG